MPSVRADLDARVRDRARALGFDAVGVARADVPLGEDFARYRAFLDQGMHGEMAYLAENASVRERVDTEAILEGARSVVCVARRYQRPLAEEAKDPPFARHVARYARGRDYHNGTRKKLRQLAAFLRSLGTPEAPVHARPLVDDAPLLERAWAARAGLGFIGKNGMLIVPGGGSFVLLGEVVTSLSLTADAPMSERCGACTRCLDACPTQAFSRPFVLDPRRCIAYLTIEHRSAIPLDQREVVGDHLFGCDDCQTVCPFNQSQSARSRPTASAEGAGRSSRGAGPATGPFEPHARWSETELVDLLALDDAAWWTLSEGSPIRRATAEGLARNAAIVLGNAGVGAPPEAAAALENAARSHPSPMVREAADWGLGRLRGR